jgi:multidrug resistance efflux pump
VTVNPIFTWVRLAQRVPVRIQIKEVPDGVVLVAGMRARVEVEPRAKFAGAETYKTTRLGGRMGLD